LIRDQVVAHIIVNPFFQRPESGRITGPAEFIHTGLGVVLVFFADVFRDIDVADIWFEVQAGESCLHQVVETAGNTCSRVLNGRGGLVWIQPIAKGDHILPVDEITDLFTVLKIRPVGAE